jgi:hypothetical protein
VKRTFAVVLFALLAASSGCAPALGTTPRSTLRAYGDAIAEGRADDAYKMLSSDAQRAIPQAAFREMVAKNRAEALELGKMLARDPGDPYVTAVVTLPNGDVVLLVYEDGRWRVDGGALEFYSQATPRQAIVGFVKAVNRSRWDVLLKYTPDAHKEGLTADRLATAWSEKTDDGRKLRDVIKEIEASLATARFEETGDRATMMYGSANATVLFVREHGSWKVEDIPIR